MKRLVLAIALSFTAALGACNQSSVSDEIAKMEKESAEAAKANLTAGEAFLAANKVKPGVVTTPSGLQLTLIKSPQPNKPTPGPNDQVAMMYEGALIDGTVFDSAYQRGQPAEFNVSGVIAGWTEALQLMHPGDQIIAVIPSDLAYGPPGRPGEPGIPPNSVLVFKMELIAFKKANGQVVQ